MNRSNEKSDAVAAERRLKRVYLSMSVPRSMQNDKLKYEQVATPKQALHRDEPPCNCEQCTEETRKADEVRRTIRLLAAEDELRFVRSEVPQ